jgi:hypothetical protein
MELESRQSGDLKVEGASQSLGKEVDVTWEREMSSSSGRYED